MKYTHLVQTLSICTTVATLALTLAACGAPVSDDQSATPTNDLPATVQAAIKATIAARPTDTPTPNVEATVEIAIQSTLAAMPTSPPTVTTEETQALERLHRSYPAPTGYPGFRKYYQKRCYPGCHSDNTFGTPTLQVAHP